MNAQLCYFGGSGGFFALWHILLGTDYNCHLNNTDLAYNDIKGPSWPALSELPANILHFPDTMQEDLANNHEWKLIVEQTIENGASGPRLVNSEFYKTQWSVNEDRSRWKENEKWPNNQLTQKSSIKNKLFFHCNPTAEDMIEDSDKKILLYTDIETQTLLAKNKHAWIYRKKTIEEIALVEKEETTKFKSDEVFYKVDEIAKYTDYQIRLQDVIRTQGQALLDIFGSTINENNAEHNYMWLKLHTDEERECLFNES